MASSLDAVRLQLGIFLRGGDYTPLWTAVMDATETVDADANISDDDREWFDELYDAVYMGAEDPVDAQSAKEGMIGAAALRVQIREMRLDQYETP